MLDGENGFEAKKIYLFKGKKKGIGGAAT